MRAIAMALGIVVLGGCDAQQDSSESPETTGATTGETTNATAQVIALPERQRNAVFFRAIRDAGLPCQSVRQSEAIKSDNEAPAWRASCDNGESHLIAVTPDGMVNIVSRPTP